MNLYPNERVQILDEGVKKEFKYNHTAVLTVDISYPQVVMRGILARNRINRYYRGVMSRFFRHASTTLYADAVREYKHALESGFPFRAYTAVMKYEITMNEDCRLCVYFDQYVYTGGAHGNTVRISDNRDLQTGCRIGMRELFALGDNYRKKVIGQILKQADANMAADPNIYFPDYRELIVKYFDTERYYLTPSGVSVFYLQYEIAPYSSGIIVFSLPYRTLGIEKPRCQG